jgi:hypothetical protein
VKIHELDPDCFTFIDRDRCPHRNTKRLYTVRGPSKLWKCDDCGKVILKETRRK